MSDFYVGQKVVCVGRGIPKDKSRPARSGECLPEIGGVYTIRDILPWVDERGEAPSPACRLTEIVNPEVDYAAPWGLAECAFDLRGFKPLEEKPDAIEVFRKMCRDAEAGKLVDA